MLLFKWGVGVNFWKLWGLGVIFQISIGITLKLIGCIYTLRMVIDRVARARELRRRSQVRAGVGARGRKNSLAAKWPVLSCLIFFI